MQTDVGANIRTIRQGRQLSLADLGQRSGLSKGFLSKVERGLSSPPIATLMRIAESLGVSMGDFFDGRPARGDQDAVLTRAGERSVVRQGAERGYIYERLAVGSRFRLTPYIIKLEEGVPDRTFEHSGEEIIFMLKGEACYQVGDEVYRLREGDTLVFDATRPHGPRKIPGRPAEFLAVFSEARE